MTGIAAKMKMAGYRTHMVGKWDAGMATPHHTPQGRGYDTSLIYFEHDNDFWTQVSSADFYKSCQCRFVVFRKKISLESAKIIT